MAINPVGVKPGFTNCLAKNYASHLKVPQDSWSCPRSAGRLGGDEGIPSLALKLPLGYLKSWTARMRAAGF